MNLRLVVERGGQRKTVALRDAETILGRSHGNTLRIPSAEVSRQHCKLTQKDGLVLVRDLDSVNGTFLNGVRIKEEEVIRPGDKIDVGPITFVVEYELTPEALERLQGMEQNVDLLEALGDGEVVEIETEPVEFEDDGGMALFQDEPEAEPEPVPVVDAPKKKKKPVKPLPDEATKPTEDLSPLKPDFDFDAGNWQMPEGGDLRGLMDEGLEEEEPPPTVPAKPKKKK